MVRLAEIVHKRENPESQLVIRVVVGSVEKKGAAKVLQSLSTDHPLQKYNLGHLKRARPSKDKSSGLLELVVCTEALYDAEIPDSIKALLSDVRVVNTYSVEPESKDEWERWTVNWPIHYRPSDLERNRAKGFTPEQGRKADEYLRLAEADAAAFSEGERTAGHPLVGMRGGVVVNPENGKVITTSHAAFVHMCKTHDPALLAKHPLYTAGMLCIHGVAETILGHLSPTETDALPSMPYLCTGLQFFLVQEPDLTSSMGIVHSRIRDLTFRHRDEEHGALTRNYRLHDMQALNHRFRVFTVEADDV